MKLQRTFVEGKMNKDLDERLVPQGQYIHAENIRVGTSEGSDIGSLENVLGNQQITNFTLGNNAFTVGYCKDSSNGFIYWMVVSDSGSYILEYDTINSTQTTVIEDTREGSDNVLNFNRTKLITDARVLVDSDNNRKFLLFTDDLNPIRQINIERAKGYGTNGFNDDDISLIKKPPLDPPSISLTSSDVGQENKIKEKFLIFAYRYKYLDGEYSALSPFSKVAFNPNTFNFDFSTSVNESMVNAFTLVDVTFNTGSKLVTDIEVVFKETNNDTVSVVESYNKVDKGWSNDSNQTIEFNNSKTQKILASDELNRLFDNVPRNAKALEVINGRLVLGNYLENYNLIDVSGDTIIPKLSLDVVSEVQVSGQSYETNKSDRNYEVGIVYGDDYGRCTTVLTGEDNTTTVPVIDCAMKNSLRVTVSNNPPSFASWYRFFIKQNRGVHDTIVPNLFYQDGAFYWLRINSSDKDKVDEGDFLVVKADARGITNNRVEVKVLEKKEQDRNFLETVDSNETLQQSGLYLKVKERGFSIEGDNLDIYEWEGYDESNTSVLGNNVKLVYPLYFYGTGLNDLSSSGTYTGSVDKRYRIELDSATTFTWSSSEGGSQSGISFTAGNPVLIEDGVSVTFGSSSGYNLNDYWTLTVKTNDSWFNDNDRAYGLFKSLDSRFIKGGSNITIIYDEYNEENQYFEYSFIASRDYETLEEWFWEDDIINQISEIDDNRVRFRNGVLNGTGAMSVSNNIDGDDVMLIRSIGTKNSFLDGTPKVRTTIKISAPNNLVLETKGEELNAETFYEVGDTYRIENNKHQGKTGDINQTVSTNATINLNTYNAFGWGNGFESSKIKDEFNATSFTNNTRPLTSIEDYKENRRIASLTYGGVYEQTTNFNGLNEFNLSLSNFKDLDDAYGSIQKLYSRDTNLIVFQEDKTFKVLYNKSILYNADGTGNLTQNQNILGQEVPFTGEYGISKNPESFAYYGNTIWHTDSNRGCILRLSADGYTEISSYGMKDYFRDYFRNNLNKNRFGGYDTYHDEYVVQINEEDLIVPNLEPSIGDLSITLPHEGTRDFIESDFTTSTLPPYSDPDGDDPMNLKIVSLPSTGSLTYSSSPVTIGQEILLSDLASNTLRYTAVDITSAYQDTFTFQVSDEGSQRYSGVGSIIIDVQQVIWNAQEITLNSSANLSTASGSPVVPPNPLGVFMKPTGDKIFLMEYGDDKIYQYSLGTAYDLGTLTYNGASSAISNDWTYGNPIGLEFSNSGLELFSIELSPLSISSIKLRKHTTSTAWDITGSNLNATPTQTFSIPERVSGKDIPRGMRFDDTGIFFLYTFESPVSGSYKPFFRVYKLSSSFDISSPTLVLETELDFSGNIKHPFAFDSSGASIDWENIDVNDTYLLSYINGSYLHIDYLDEGVSYPVTGVGTLLSTSLVNSERIIAVRSDGDIYLYDTNLGGSGTPDDFTPPSTPATILVSYPTVTGYTLSSATSTDVDSPPVQYRFYKDDVAQGSWQSSPTFIVTGEATGSTASWKVRSRDSATIPNESSFSPVSVFGTITQEPNLILSSTSSNSLSINIGAVTGGVSYKLEYKPSSSSTWVEWSYGGTSGAVTITGLLDDTSYDIRALAYNVNNNPSAYSTILTSSTSGETPTPVQLTAVQMALETAAMTSCQDPTDQLDYSTAYHDGNLQNPNVGDTIYEDSAGTMPLQGLNNWFRVINGFDCRVNNSGVVQEVVSCPI